MAVMQLTGRAQIAHKALLPSKRSLERVNDPPASHLTLPVLMSGGEGDGRSLLLSSLSSDVALHLTAFLGPPTICAVRIIHDHYPKRTLASP